MKTHQKNDAPTQPVRQNLDAAQTTEPKLAPRTAMTDRSAAAIALQRFQDLANNSPRAAQLEQRASVMNGHPSSRNRSGLEAQVYGLDKYPLQRRPIQSASDSLNYFDDEYTAVTLIRATRTSNKYSVSSTKGQGKELSFEDDSYYEFDAHDRPIYTQKFQIGTLADGPVTLLSEYKGVGSFGRGVVNVKTPTLLETFGLNSCIGLLMRNGTAAFLIHLVLNSAGKKINTAKFQTYINTLVTAFRANTGTDPTEVHITKGGTFDAGDEVLDILKSIAVATINESGSVSFTVPTITGGTAATWEATAMQDVWDDIPELPSLSGGDRSYKSHNDNHTTSSSGMGASYRPRDGHYPSSSSREGRPSRSHYHGSSSVSGTDDPYALHDRYTSSSSPRTVGSYSPPYRNSSRSSGSGGRYRSQNHYNSSSSAAAASPYGSGDRRSSGTAGSYRPRDYYNPSSSGGSYRSREYDNSSSSDERRRHARSRSRSPYRGPERK